MSFAADHIRKIDGQLEQLLLPRLTDQTHGGDLDIESRDGSPRDSARSARLHSLTRSLLTNPTRRGSSITSDQLLRVVRELQDLQRVDPQIVQFQATHELELLWFLLAKVTSHVYGITLQSLIDQTLPLNNDLWYWTDVLSSPTWTAMYSAQTSPLRLWNWGRSIYDEVYSGGTRLSDGWRKFYDRARSIARERSLSDVRQRIMVPWTLVTEDVRSKLTALRSAKVANASALGYLLSNGFGDESLRIDKMINGNGPHTETHDVHWKITVFRSASAVSSVLTVVVRDPTIFKDSFETAIHTMAIDDPLAADNPFTEGVDVDDLTTRLKHILEIHLPRLAETSQQTLAKSSKPSRLIRYWIPAATLLISSSTILRIVANRRAEMLQWVRDLGSTTIDFWQNWVIDPLRKVIGTIRHDENSEVSIMSKQSLQGDQASLERMVVDFAMDNRDGPPLSEVDIADLRTKIHEGDLTPVLKAYERDLKSPLYGTVRGNLIRALLIQVQKTKVDVEIAIGGIDSLLKSQELVFGFIGLTPGILVCVGLFRWFASLPATRRDFRRGQKQSQSYRILRNIDRILTASPQSNGGTLSFRDYGLLVCEAIVLRDMARQTFPKDTFREFVGDFDDLLDNNSGVGRQIRVADRIRWAYSRWL